MSPLDAMRAAMASKLDATPKAVLVAWCSHVNGDGVAWPGVALLMERTSLGERAVRGAMSRLRDLHVLRPTGASEAGTTVYRLDADALAAVERPERTPARRAPPALGAPLHVVHPPAPDAPPPLHHVQAPPAPRAPKEVMEEDTRRGQTSAVQEPQPLLLTPPPATPKPATLIAEQIERVYEAYKAHHPRKALKPSAGEQRAIRDRLRELVDSNGRKVTDPEAVRAAGDALLTMIAWVHAAPDAAWWRDNKRLGLEAPLMKLDKFAERMASADEWAARGRPGDPAAARASPSTRDTTPDRLDDVLAEEERRRKAAGTAALNPFSPTARRSPPSTDRMEPR